ncbi:transporter substrate-binding domain-containing protein [Prodigiosinella aquatilis]|nr:transporter substrate-binding domain-containing protein [Prodigiosinella sp. LS101]WJV53248.1 transporter substrate-binding domain-containing protein [Prodigiosinella sp. LS101]WJV57610.1 transporter substrate-binding domain-containing protein [Pectobacteriaceae bacterium C111]
MNHIGNVFQKSARVFLMCCVAAMPLIASAADNTLENVKSANVLRIGVASGDPWYYKDPISGNWTGVGYKIGERIAKDLGVKLMPVETTYGNAAAALQANQIDIMLVLDATEERKKALDFPQQPLLWYKQGVLARTGVKADKWEDLNKPEVRIGVVLGTATDRDLTKRLPNANIERFSNTDETVAAFMANRIDVFAFYHPALAIAQSHIRTGNLVIPEPVVEMPTSAGVRKESDQVWVHYINAEFQKLNNEGFVQKVFSDYMASKGLDPNKIPSIKK